MKRTVYFLLLLVVIGVIAAGIVDSMRMFSADIDNHLWTGFIDRWQCREKGYYEIEFFTDETFVEYYFGRKKGSGAVERMDDEIILRYDRESCRWKGLSNCEVYLEYFFPLDELVLIIDGERMTFSRRKETR
jgi:hypothetical protein